MPQYIALLCLLCWQSPIFAQLLAPEALEKTDYIKITDEDQSALDTIPLHEIYRLNWRQYEYEPDDYIFEDLTKMDRLQVLHLYLYPNRKKLPKQVLELNNLEELSINCDEFVDVTDDFQQLQKLKRLGLEYYSWSFKQQQILPLDIRQLPQLEMLALSAVKKIHPNDLDRIAQLSKLKKLYLQDSWFNAIPSNRNAFHGLETLLLSLPDKYTRLPQGLETLSELEELIIQAPFLNQEDFDRLAQLPKLKTLTLHGAQIEHLPKSIAQLQTLKELNFIHTTCDNWQKGIQVLSKLPNLEKIILPNNVGEADYSKLHTVKEVGIWQDYDPPYILNIIEFGTYFFNDLDLEALLPSLKTFPQLEQIDFKSYDLDFMKNLLSVLEHFSVSPSSPAYEKDSEYVAWFGSKLNPSALQQLKDAMIEMVLEAPKQNTLMDRVHLFQYIKSTERMVVYGNALIQEAREQNLATAEIQDIEAVVYYYTGYQYQQQKDWKKAIVYFEKSLAIRKQRGDKLKYALLNLANLYRDKGDWDNFERYIDLIVDDTKQDGYNSFYLEAIPKLFEEKNYERAEDFFENVLLRTGVYFSMTDEDTGDFFYRLLYNDVVRQGTIKEQQYWIKRWVKFIEDNVDPYEARKVLREVINDFSNDLKEQEAAYYTQQLIDFEREQCRYDQSEEALEFLHYALRLRCYILMSSNQLSAVIDAYIELIKFLEENNLDSLEKTLNGLNELSAKIYYNHVSKKQAEAAFIRLKKWKEIAQNKAVKAWLAENIELIESRF